MVDEPVGAVAEAPETSQPSDPGGAEPQQPTDTQEAVAPVAGAEDDDASEFDDPVLDAQYKDDPRYQSFKQRSRKLEKWAKKHRATVDLVENAGMTPQELLYQARTAQVLNEQMQQNPRLRALIYGEQESEKPLAPAKPRMPDWNDDEYPFDPEDKGGRWLREQMRARYEFQRQAQDRLDYFEDTLQRVVSRILGGERQTQTEMWNSAVTTAAERLPEFSVAGERGQRVALRNLFRDNCLAALQIAREKGTRIDKTLVHRIIEHYLPASAGVNANSPQGRRVQAAAAQKMAESNKALPKASAMTPSGGQPVPAVAGKKMDSLKDFNDRLKRMAP